MFFCTDVLYKSFFIFLEERYNFLYCTPNYIVDTCRFKQEFCYRFAAIYFLANKNGNILECNQSINCVLYEVNVSKCINASLSCLKGETISKLDYKHICKCIYIFSACSTIKQLILFMSKLLILLSMLLFFGLRRF